MGVVTMTIGGTDVMDYVQIGSLQIEHYLNNRPVLRCRLRVKEGAAYTRPSVRDEVIVEDDSVRIFGGIVFNVKETDVVNYLHRDLDIDCTGFEVHADNILINAPVPAGSLKDQLTVIVNNLGGSPPHPGLSVDPTMPAGPAQDPQAFPFLTCRQAMDQIATASGWNWKFDFHKKVRMDPPGTFPAPFSLTDLNSTISRLEHSSSLANYVNDIWLIFGSSAQQEVTDRWAGNGSNKIFPLHYPPIAAAPAPTSVIEGVTPYSVAAGPGVGRWYFDAPSQELRVNTSEPAPMTVPITSTFTAQFPIPIHKLDSAEVAARGTWSMLVTYPDLYDWFQANYITQGELDRRKGIWRRLTARTYSPGLEPGMHVSVTATKRGLSSVNFLIERLTIQHEAKRANGTHVFSYEIEGLEQNKYQQNWIEFFRKLQGKNGSGGGGAASTPGGPIPALPTTVPYAFWGGSRQFGVISATYVNAIDYVKIRLDGTLTPQVTVRVFLRTANSGTEVQAQIVNSNTLVSKGATPAISSTSWVEELITFFPDAGPADYHLQLKGDDANAQVFAMANAY